MPASFRAIVRTESGVVLVDRAREPLPPSCVRIRIKRTGLCRTDCRAAQGRIPTRANLTLGHEASGIVVEVAAASDLLREGDHVTIWPHVQHGKASLQLGVELDGTFAEEVVVPERNAFRVPSTMPFERAAYFEPLVAALGAYVEALSKEDSVHVHGDGRIAELTRRALRVSGTRLVAADEDPAWCVLPSPSEEAVRRLMQQAPNARFVLKLPSRGSDFDRATYERTGARCVTATYGSQSRALELLQEEAFKVEDLFEEPLPLRALLEHLMSQDDETKKAFFNPELAH